MPSDKVTLQIGNKEIGGFLSYEIGSDLYVADDDFTLELADPGIEIDPGLPCRLYVNDTLELNGIIEKVVDAEEKERSTLTVTGRDLMGLLVSSCVEEFVTLEGVTIKALAETLLKKVPFINRKAIVYGAGPKDLVKEKSEGALFGEAANLAQTSPSQTIFDVLKDYAVARGLLFWGKPDGTPVFGKPVDRGEPVFSLVRRMDGVGNNVKSSTRTRDISGRYSKVTVLGQRQGGDAWAAADINASGTAVEDTFPFYKPFVQEAGSDVTALDKQARLIMEKQRVEGERFVYTVAGHSQGGRNWQVNARSLVLDERRGIDEAMTITGRVFRGSKEEGSTTELRLSRLRP